MAASSWNYERRKEYNRAYTKRRKASFKARGICPNCEKRPAAPSRTCCFQCLEDKKITSKFGTAEPYRQLNAELFEKQQGLCGICKNPMKRPVLDHNHITMEVRGFLCSNCNVGLGQFKDNPDLLKAAIFYIENNAGIGVKLKQRKHVLTETEEAS
jgi:hypothetical protein